MTETPFELARKRLRTYPHRIDNADAGLIEGRVAELEAEVALQKALVDEALDLPETVEADGVLATNARLVGLLREQEWCIGTDRGWCHHCRRYRDDGHTADCPLLSALVEQRPGGTLYGWVGSNSRGT